MSTRDLVPVSELCSFVGSGGTPSRSNALYFGGTVPWVKTMDLPDGPVAAVDECITERGVENSAAVVVPTGTTLIAMYGATVGRLGYLVFPAACNQAACALVADPAKADSRWLYYAMMATRQRLISLASGAAQQNLNVSLVRAHQVPRLALPAQKAMAEVLGALDDKIAANRATQVAARALVAATIQACEARCSLSELVTTQRGSVAPDAMPAEGVTHFSLPAFDEGSTRRERPTEIKSSKLDLRVPVLLVSKLNPRIPRIWPVDVLPQGRSVASTEFVALAPRRGLAVGELWAAALDPMFTEQLLARTAGTTGSHQRVRPNDLLEVSVPDVRRLSEEVRDLTRSACRLTNQAADANRRLAVTRDELLPLLMSGRITVKDAERRAEEEL